MSELNRPQSNEKKRAGYVGLLAFCVVALGLAGYWMSSAQKNAPTVIGKVTIAIPTQVSSALMIVASAQDLFKKAGVEVVNQPFLLGKEALNSLLDGKADLAVVADTPYILSLSNGSDIAIFAGISQARRALAIVARIDRGITTIQDLDGKSIGVTPGTNMAYFTDAFLQVNRIASEKVKLVDMKTDEINNALKDGSIDAGVVFQPFLAKLELSMGDQIKVFHSEEVYAFRFLLVGKPSFIDQHPDEIRRVLTALIEANEVIQMNPEAARKTVGEVVKLDDATMAKFFDPEDYVVTLDQAMLLALDDQTRWAMKRGIIKQGPVPNYVQVMKYQSLEAVRPSAVKVIR